MDKRVKSTNPLFKGFILAFGAHNDDHIIGAGGSLARFAKEGYKVLTIVFSYGEMSHPHLKEDFVREKRIRESLLSNQIMHGEDIIYLGLREGNFRSDFDAKLQNRINHLLTKYSPKKIFTHSIDDVHPDHRAVFQIITSSVKAIDLKAELYSFDVSNIVNLRNRNNPKLIIDTSDYFKTKIDALKCHQSQIYLPSVYILFWKIYIKDFLHGFYHSCRTAEVFTRIQ